MQLIVFVVYTKLAPRSAANLRTSQNRASSSPSNAVAESLAKPAESNELSTSTAAEETKVGPMASGLDVVQTDQQYQATPPPLNTATTSQRTVSAPGTGLSSTMASNPPTQRSISVMMENNRPHGEDSPVMNETLSVIDEHITDMNTPRSSLLAAEMRGLNDSGSEYSSHFDHRQSYINGHETDDEERNSLTTEEVMQWTPKDVAECLRDIGVERKHCEIFREQEISGEVLLGMDQASIFMKEFDLGLVGRRLRTWHKIKAFQDEVRSNRPAAKPSAVESHTSVDSFDQSASTNPPVLPRISGLADRSTTPRHSRQESPRIQSESRPISAELNGMPKPSPTDSPKRPSAASVRDYNHSRRHSSMEFNSKSDAMSFGQTSKTSTPPTSPDTSHRKQPSLDRNWTMGAFPPSSGSRTSVALGLSALGMTSHALNLRTDRNTFDPSNLDPGTGVDGSRDLDRDYASGGEGEGRKYRNVLRKNYPTSASHSRQSSQKEEARTNSIAVSKRHSRFGSAGSIRDAIASVTSSSPKIPSGEVSSKARSRTWSLREKGSATGLTDDKSSSSSPMVTKLEYAESPTSVTSPKLGRGSSVSGQDSPLQAESTANKPRAGMRSVSEAVTGSEKSQASPSYVPQTRETQLRSPTRAESTNTSTASQSADVESLDASVRESSQPTPALTPTNGSKRAKSKKDTSAYQKGLVKCSPQEAMKECDYSGWMKKKSPRMTSTWKSRLFVLRGRRLGYYYSENDSIEKGVIDISAHRVLPADNEFLTGLHATLTGAKSSPTSPANAQTVTTNATEVAAQKDGTGSNEGESMFIFKLVPPRAGFSRAISFTKPMVHYFAVDNVKQGRLWMAALMKATIDRDESKPITSTYSQKTISLNKAVSMKQRPPALMMVDEQNVGKEEDEVKDESSNSDEPGLNIQGLNLSYEYIAADSNKETSENGTVETKTPISAPFLSENHERLESSRQAGKESTDEGHEGTTGTLRTVRSLNGDLRGMHDPSDPIDRPASDMGAPQRPRRSTGIQTSKKDAPKDRARAMSSTAAGRNNTGQSLKHKGFPYGGLHLV